MPTEIVMPNLGFDTQEARLVEWLKQPGDSVRTGEVLAIVESDKANVELESVASGVLLEVHYPADTLIPVGSVIALIGAAGEKTTTSQPAVAPAQTQSAPSTSIPSTPSSQPSSTPAEFSPIARRIALEHGLDLSQIKGSGARGRVTREDVEALLSGGNGHGANGKILALPKVRQAARDAGINLSEVTPTGNVGQITMADLANYQHRRVEQPASSVTPTPITPLTSSAPVAPASSGAIPDGSHEIPLSRMRQIIGQRLTQSKQSAPHFYVTGEFDLEAGLVQLRTLPEPQPRVNDLLQYLVVQTLLRVPELNATFDGEHLYQYNAVNLAIAVAREDGLITPVVQGADRFSLKGLADESRALIGRARDNRLQPADLQNGTFTMSNLGIIKQVDHFTAVINPPQVAILAVGTVKQRPVVVDGGLHIRHTVHMTLSGDHRVVDGMHLARFMATFQEELDKFCK